MTKNLNQKNVWAVILAGGSGKRLWPLSRKSLPKQFLELSSSNSLLNETITRAKSINGLKKVLIVAGNSHLSLIKETLRDFKELDFLILIEPEARNTAPAIFAAAQYIESQEKSASIIVMPSDHYYEETDFSETIEDVMNSTDREKLLTLGIKPTSPEISYGYIQFSDAEKDKTIKKVVLFKEKPNLEKAKDYLSSGGFYWNSGIFIFDSSFIIKEFNEHITATNDLKLTFNEQNNVITILEEEFIQLPNISIDYAILESSKNTYTSEFKGKWSDLGSWNHLRDHNADSKGSNSSIGNKIYFQDSSNNLVFSKNRTIGISGLSDIAVIDTPDALLVTNLVERENPNEILEKIEEADKEIFDTNQRTFRPWGWFESIESGSGFQVKRILVYPNEQLSVQKHFHRSERWVVIRGEATIQLGDTTDVYKQGDMVSIGQEEIHCLSNCTDSDVEIIEVQLGSYLGEDDIVRYSDKYGRE